MKSLLALKPWQLFAIMWGIPFLTVFIPLENMTPFLVGILSAMFGLIYFLWLYSIGNSLPKMFIERYKFPTKLFQFHIWYLILIIFLSAFAYLAKDQLQEIVVIFLLVVLYSMVAIFIVLRFVAKVISTVELNRIAKLNDYILYFFLLWFSPIGIWIIQPKIRKYFLQK